MQNFPINLTNLTGGQTATWKPQNALGDGGTNKNFNGGCLSYNYIMPVRYCELKGERRVYFPPILPVSRVQAELQPKSLILKHFNVPIYMLYTYLCCDDCTSMWIIVQMCMRMCVQARTSWG